MSTITPGTETERKIWSLLKPQRGASAHDRTDRIAEMKVYREASKWFVVPEGVDPADHWRNHRVVGKWFRMIDDSSRVLDLGCGVGWPALALAPFALEVVGIDASPEMIRIGRRLQQRLDTKKNVTLQTCDAANMPFDSDDFDVCVSDNMIDVVDNQREILKEVFRVLKPGALFALDFQSGKIVFRENPVREDIEFENYSGIPKFIYRVWVKEPAYLEREYIMLLDPDTELARKVMDQPPDEASDMPVDVDLALESTLSCRFFECVHFDNETLTALLTEAGFTDISELKEGSLSCRKPFQ